MVNRVMLEDSSILVSVADCVVLVDPDVVISILELLSVVDGVVYLDSGVVI